MIYNIFYLFAPLFWGQIRDTELRWQISRDANLASFAGNSTVALRACKQYLTHAPSLSAKY